MNESSNELYVTTENFYSCDDIAHQAAGNDIYGRYVLHSMTVCSTIDIENETFDAIYQNGLLYEHNDYSCPSNRLQLSDDAGAHPLLMLIDELCAEDFDLSERREWLVSLLESVRDIHADIDSLAKLRTVYDALKDSTPRIGDFIDLEKYTDDLNDYDCDEMTGLLTLKSANKTQEGS